MRKNVLKVPVDILTKTETVDLIAGWVNSAKNMKLVVTAYSEFFVQAQRDPDFLSILQSADLVTPDGVSVLAANKYLARTQELKESRTQDRDRSRTQVNFVGRVAEGLKVGGEIISGKMGETVTGVWLFETLTKMAAERDWKIFLLGGWDNVSSRAAQMLLKRFPKIKIATDEGEKHVGTDETTNNRVIEKINKFAPDILFVSYNPIKQEKWLAKYRDVLKVKVGIGVGGTFNEFLGEFKKAPAWMEKAGLKWLWRVIVDPKRIGRILRAVIVFPWLVFNNK
jgi:N-acetylglucosaminyldiphosphoundecaprenol N-acetyl-beta-D-mannosaminyltransferase